MIDEDAVYLAALSAGRENDLISVYIGRVLEAAIREMVRQANEIISKVEAD